MQCVFKQTAGRGQCKSDAICWVYSQSHEPRPLCGKHQGKPVYTMPFERLADEK